MNKKSIILFVSLTLVAAMISTALVAQTKHDQAGRQKNDKHEVAYCKAQTTGCHAIPDLTDDQKTKIESLKLKTQKELLGLNNQLMEKKARLRTLSTVDSPDSKAINKTIDDIANLQGDIKKAHMSNRLEIRKLLNEKQRLAFDSRAAGWAGMQKWQAACKGKPGAGCTHEPSKK